MILRSMTATFGKLDHAQLSLEPGLNLLQGPNEWGKSTWCAFLTAMLYGIETRAHTTKAALADKERYAPWSGSPMEGRLELTWEGRNITIERRSRGRIPFGVFRAYETETGLDVPELTAANCGQVLLGVEKSVFLRSAFLRMTDLPVSQDDALRRRLNALVTTGEESGTAEALAQRLREIKNRCRLNRNTGLLPQAQARCRELEQKLEELLSLREQAQRHKQRLAQLEEHKAALENHRATLEFASAQGSGQKLREAQDAQRQAKETLSTQEALCATLPPADLVDRALLRLRQLRDAWDAAVLEQQMLSPSPDTWDPPTVFRERSPEDAIAQATEDHRCYQVYHSRGSFPWYWLLPMLLAVLPLIFPNLLGWVLAGVGVISGFIGLFSAIGKRRRKQKAAEALLARYAPLAPEHWVEAAREYARNTRLRQEAQAQRCREQQMLELRLKELNQQLQDLSATDWAEAQREYDLLSEARREYHRTAELAQALASAHREIPSPLLPDTMTYSPQETARLLSDCAQEQRQVQLKLGTLLGRMEAMDTEDFLRQQLAAEQSRVRELEDTCAAVELALDTLAEASAALQRRFAPAITRRAQELFSRLTGGSYDRLSLSEDLSLMAGAHTEATLRSPLWRSDGTADQLYLALRLALSEALAPNAPLILDDALVRFDDQRLQKALEVLGELSQNRQILLFTCQSREAQYLPQK